MKFCWGVILNTFICISSYATDWKVFINNLSSDVESIINFDDSLRYDARAKEKLYLLLSVIDYGCIQQGDHRLESTPNGGNNHGINYDIVYMRYTRASLGVDSGKTRRRRDKIEEVLY